MGEYDFDASAVPSDLSKRDQPLFTKSEPTQDYEDIKKATKEFVKAIGKTYADSSSISGERTHSDGPLPSGWSAREVDRHVFRSSSTKSTEPVLMKKAKTDNVGFGGLDQDHYAECYPGSVLNININLITILSNLFVSSIIHLIFCTCTCTCASNIHTCIIII
ncbi:PREDICTED: uncharacterized protein LOC109591971 isoform X3 [Amphimedon queenslandica]|nr:PREDICTED: uncharacterized protein LOC109591971 isoform X3 [Amphimedon queenslandica]XP_019863117.1 PREDICTED: uncharacterized protein LOC109591971 isoform X3 [Amphimedon queenslandica]XP_019863118.1 PREDICTED: uncharacterized protein LOC109591971 isoform X3 [Amphimedon queenslandica]|eukprot:XP_019863115.1 PREDICTED: uncharacterized protein LOC109591971 isoform X3 [Amphimedon queenslandica]